MVNLVNYTIAARFLAVESECPVLKETKVAGTCGNEKHAVLNFRMTPMVALLLCSPDSPP